MSKIIRSAFIDIQATNLHMLRNTAVEATSFDERQNALDAMRDIDAKLVAVIDDSRFMSGRVFNRAMNLHVETMSIIYSLQSILDMNRRDAVILTATLANAKKSQDEMEATKRIDIPTHADEAIDTVTHAKIGLRMAWFRADISEADYFDSMALLTNATCELQDEVNKAHEENSRRERAMSRRLFKGEDIYCNTFASVMDIERAHAMNADIIAMDKRIHNCEATLEAIRDSIQVRCEDMNMEAACMAFELIDAAKSDVRNRKIGGNPDLYVARTLHLFDVRIANQKRMDEMVFFAVIHNETNEVADSFVFDDEKLAIHHRNQFFSPMFYDLREICPAYDEAGKQGCKYCAAKVVR